MMLELIIFIYFSIGLFLTALIVFLIALNPKVTKEMMEHTNSTVNDITVEIVLFMLFWPVYLYDIVRD